MSALLGHLRVGWGHVTDLANKLQVEARSTAVRTERLLAGVRSSETSSFVKTIIFESVAALTASRLEGGDKEQGSLQICSAPKA